MTSSRIPYIASVVPNDWNSLLRFSRDVQKYLSSLAKSDQSVTYDTLTLTGLGTNTLIYANTSNELTSATIGTGLNFSAPTLSLSHLGLENLTDPDADRILFWDDSNGATKWLATGNSLAITDTTLDTIQDIRTTASPTFNDLTISSPVNIYALSHDSFADFASDEHVAHSSISITAGTNMTGGGTIDSSVTLNVDPTSAGQWDDAYTHISSNGTDHTYIDQDVTTTASPVFGDLTVTDRLLLDSTDFITNAGYLAGNSTTGVRNVNLGAYAGYNLTEGEKNTNIGYYAGYGLTSGVANTGDYNMFLGHSTGPYNTTGSNNVAVGGNAFNRNTEGNNNVCIGYGSGFLNTTGSRNIFIGESAGRRQTTTNDLLIIDNQDRTSAANELTNALMYGVFDSTPGNQSLRINGEILGSYGAKIGDGGTTNYAEFETDGTLEFHGTATVWDDANVGGLSLGGPSSNLPDEVIFLDNTGASTGIYTYGFAVGEKVSGIIEIPHGYKEGSNITPHVHWQGDTTPTGTDKVQWQLTYTVQSPNATKPPVTTIPIETDFDTQYKTVRSDFAAITGTNFKIGDQFCFTLERIAASTDEYGGDAKIETVGFHYEKDTIGSRSIVTK